MNQRKSFWKTALAKRVAALALAAAMAFGLVPVLTAEAEAAEWMEPYLEKVMEWGVMRGNSVGDLNPDRQITRAEFVTMVNRAFGYTEVGPNPFTDVPADAWYAEDICIAHKAGYFNGTTANTASPNALVTREQAAVLIGRNLRLQGSTGETLGFTDSRQMGVWSRGLVQEAANLGIIQGYQDGSFRPKNSITRGQVAVFLVRALGTLINDPGEQSVGGVYGNLTVNVPGVALKDTVVTGNLYLTGGVGLGNIDLENVEVRGKIVVCGAGESHKGKSSIVLRNVTATGMEVDSLTDQFMTVKAEGLTNINTTTVRTSAYLEDLTRDGLGLQTIQLDGMMGAQLQLAGNIKEFVNLTPASTVNFAQGVGQKVTVDEKAVGSTLNIDGSAKLNELNLDVGTTITGTGDLDRLMVSAAGSTVPMLPDVITIRPGITADIKGETMDSAAAAESSEDPRILSGYPDERNVASKSAEVVFSTNKKGTLYWGLSALADGSLDEEDLVNPPAVSSKLIKSGSIVIKESKKEVTAKLSGLTQGGSYYVSAVLVDDRGMRSQVKVAAFTTPDETTPAFTSGYPKVILAENDEEEQIIQAQVMANKNCQLYYVLLPEGSSAPKAADFKSGAISGSLGDGVEELAKNTPWLISQVNTAHLKEQTTYDLYLWLTDADTAKSSAVKKLEVTTLDKTPPKIQHLTVTGVTEKSVTLTYALDEPGTFYWAVVKKGDGFYYVDSEGRTPDAEEEVAKIQVESGVGALKSGKSNASKAATDVKFTVSGLAGETTYDLYFVAKDKAGNYNVYTRELTPPYQINTLDGAAPTVEQEFTHPGSDEGEPLTPYPDTSIRLVFSETVQGLREVDGQVIRSAFLDMYQASVEETNASKRAELKEKLAEALAYHIKLYRQPLVGQVELPVDRNGTTEEYEDLDWLVDFRKATVTMDPYGSGGMIITLPYDADPAKSGLNLASGATYYFTLEGIADTSNAENRMKGTRGITKLETFTTIDAQLIFSRGTSTGRLADGTELNFHMDFRITPVTAASVGEDILWDLLFWSSSDMSFELYYRDAGDTVWKQVGGDQAEAAIETHVLRPTVGISMTRELLSATEAQKNNPNFEQLRKLNVEYREYGIIVTELTNSRVSTDWSGTVSMTVVPVSGDKTSLSVLSNTASLTPETYEEHQEGLYRVNEIGVPKEYTVSRPFRDSTPPTFTNGYPLFEEGDSGVNIDIMLSRDDASYFYVITEMGNIPTTINVPDGNGGVTPVALKDTTEDWEKLPEDGSDLPVLTDASGEKIYYQPNAILPTNSSITNPRYDSTVQGDGTKTYIVDQGSYTGFRQRLNIPQGLKADTEYVAYFVLQGESPESISDVYAFRFKTEKVVRPVLSISLQNPNATISSDDRAADVHYMLVVAGMQSGLFDMTMAECADTGANSAWSKLTDAQRAKYGGLSMLEAMRDPVTSNDVVLGSVFDMYAHQTYKDDAADLILNAGTDGDVIVTTGNTTLTNENNYRYTHDFTKNMSGSAEYWIVAAGKSPLGSGYAFRANGYLFTQDKQHPMVISLNTTVKTDLYTTEKDALTSAYSGEVYLVFDEYLHYKESNQKWPQIVDKKLYTGNGNYKSSTALLTMGGLVSIVHAVSDDTTEANFPHCESLRFKFDNVYVNESFSLNARLSDSRGNTGENPLSLTLKLEKTSEGVYYPQFVIDSPDWDDTARK